MSLLGRLLPEPRAWNPGWAYIDGTIPPPGYSGPVAGVSDTADLSTQLVDAYACISLLEDDLQQLPIDTFRKDDKDRVPAPPPPVLDQPDPGMESWEWIARIVGSMATRGNAYGYLYDRDRRGYPTRCAILPPADVDVYRRDGQRRYKVRSADFGHDDLPASEILHIPLTVMPGQLKGMSPIAVAKRTLTLAAATEEFGARWFTDGATPSSVFESDEDVSDEYAQTILARWVASHGGRRRPAFLGGGLKWKAVQIAPNESQFLETRKLNTEQVCRIWRVPPHMVGSITDNASQGGGKGIQAQRMGYVVHTLGPYLTRIERALSSTKISPRGQYVKFNVSGLLRGDTPERFACYAIARQWGWMSVNDIRRLEDLPPIDEGGDVYLQPINMVDAEKALQVLLDNQNGAVA